MGGSCPVDHVPGNIGPEGVRGTRTSRFSVAWNRVWFGNLAINCCDSKFEGIRLSNSYQLLKIQGFKSLAARIIFHRSIAKFGSRHDVEQLPANPTHLGHCCMGMPIWRDSCFNGKHVISNSYDLKKNYCRNWSRYNLKVKFGSSASGS